MAGGRSSLADLGRLSNLPGALTRGCAPENAPLPRLPYCKSQGDTVDVCDHLQLAAYTHTGSIAIIEIIFTIERTDLLEGERGKQH